MKKIKYFLFLIPFLFFITNNSFGSEKENISLEVTSCKDPKNCNKQIIKNNLLCSSNYSPICGEKNGFYKTYTNSCFLSKDNAKHKYAGTCGNKIKNTTPNISDKNKVKKSKPKNNIDVEPYLNYKLKLRVNRALSKLTRNIKRKNLSIAKNRIVINKLITKLNNIKKSKPQSSVLINYIVYKLKEYINNL